jgi:hypothetical protein
MENVFRYVNNICTGQIAYMDRIPTICSLAGANKISL